MNPLVDVDSIACRKSPMIPRSQGAIGFDPAKFLSQRHLIGALLTLIHSIFRRSHLTNARESSPPVDFFAVLYVPRAVRRLHSPLAPAFLAT